MKLSFSATVLLLFFFTLCNDKNKLDLTSEYNKCTEMYTVYIDLGETKGHPKRLKVKRSFKEWSWVCKICFADVLLNFPVWDWCVVALPFRWGTCRVCTRVVFGAATVIKSMQWPSDSLDFKPTHPCLPDLIQLAPGCIDYQRGAGTQHQ